MSTQTIEATAGPSALGLTTAIAPPTNVTDSVSEPDPTIDQEIKDPPLTPSFTTIEPDPGPDRQWLFVVAVYDFLEGDATGPSALSFKAGTTIQVLTQLESGWWDGLIGTDRRGWFPSNYVRDMTDEEYADHMESVANGSEVILMDSYEGEEQEGGVEVMRTAEDEVMRQQGLRQAEMQRVEEMHKPRKVEQGDWQIEENYQGGSGSREGGQSIGRGPNEEMNSPIDQASPRETSQLPYDRSPAFSTSSAVGGAVRLQEAEMNGNGGEFGVGRAAYRPSSGGSASEYWIPSLTPDGQLCYVNTRTGEQAWEAPNLDETGSITSAENNASTTSHSNGTVTSRQTSSHGKVMIPLRSSSVDEASLDREPDSGLRLPSGGNGFAPYGKRGGDLPYPWVSKMLDDGSGYRYVNQETGESTSDLSAISTRSGGQSPSLELNGTELSSGFASYAKKGGEVSYPWIAKLMDDGSGYVYVNQDTGESTTDYSAAAGGKTGSGAMSRAVEAMRALGISTGGSKALGGIRRNGSLSSIRSNRLSLARSDTSGIDSPRLRNSVHGSTKSGTDSSLTPSERASNWEDETIRMLSAEMDASPHASKTIEDYQSTVMKRVSDIIAASEGYVAACASGSEFVSPTEAEYQTMDEKADILRLTVRAIIPPVRRLVHACRHAVLGLPEEVYSSVDIHDHMMKKRALAHLSPDSLHPLQRKVVAALSKIVFFCHTAVGMDWPFPGSAERIATDAKDLQRSVVNFVSEVRKIGCLMPTEDADRAPKGLKANSGHLQLWDEGLVDRVGHYTKKREWKRLEEAVVTRFQEQATEQAVLLSKIASAELEGSATLSQAVSTYEGLSLWLGTVEDLDVAVGLDLDGPSLRSSAYSTDDSLRYKKQVTEATEAFKVYERRFRNLQDWTGLLLMRITSQSSGKELSEAFTVTQTYVKEIESDLGRLLDISRLQASIAAETGIKGRTGKRSLRISERERVANLVKSASRHSSLNSITSTNPPTDVQKPLPQTPAVARGVAPVRQHPNPSRDSLNINPSQSQTSLLSRTISGQQTPVSRRSSGSGRSWTQGEGESTAGSVRQSIMGRVPFFRTRSTSNVASVTGNGRPSPTQDSKSKMKLQKLLGEDDFDRSPIIKPPPTTPTYLKSDLPDADLVMHPDGTVKAGTLPALVEHLTMHNAMDAAFNSTFLMTFRSFTTPQAVYDLLCKRYEIQPPEGLDETELEDWREKKMKPVKFRVYNIFKSGVDQQYIGSQDSDVLSQIQEFANTVMANDVVKMPVSTLVKAIQRSRNEGGDNVRKRILTNTTSMPPAPIIPKIPQGKALQLLDINPLELARQMTIMESQLYAKIQPLDCLDKAWSEQDAPEKGLNIRAMILNSNRIAAWVGEAILAGQDVKRRANVFKHWVATADACRSLNNFSSMMAIMAGLNSGPIHRLARTKNMLSSKIIQLMDDMDHIMQTQKNYATYRELLKTLVPPCTPFLGVYLQFLTFIADGNADNIPCPTNPDRQLIHFFKRQKAADIIREIQQYQQVPYTLTAIQPVMDYINLSLANAENAPDPWETSQRLEPRETAEEKIARVLKENGYA